MDHKGFIIREDEDAAIEFKKEIGKDLVCIAK